MEVKILVTAQLSQMDQILATLRQVREQAKANGLPTSLRKTDNGSILRLEADGPPEKARQLAAAAVAALSNAGVNRFSVDVGHSPDEFAGHVLVEDENGDVWRLSPEAYAKYTVAQDSPGVYGVLLGRVRAVHAELEEPEDEGPELPYADG